MPLVQYDIEDPAKASALSALLCSWYDIKKRDLVWRQTQEPYSIWVSEIMAQQTRITAVLPYYIRFMERFPTIWDLANAPADDVLKAWEGLGYYSRAHNLLKTAQIVVNDYNGKFPTDIRLIKKLPGIGDYTAGAIASICFHQPEPAVDGNVLRVFARLYDNSLNISETSTKKLLTVFLRTIIPADKPGLFNQALMELGALVCVPKNPSCPVCPVRTLCKAYEQGKQNQLPVKSAKKDVKQLDITVLLIKNAKDQILMRQRNEKLLNGLWEFYMVEQALDTVGAKKRVQGLGYMVTDIVPAGKATHRFTHIQWNMNGYQCEIEGGEPPSLTGYEFIPTEELQRLAIPVAVQFYKEWLIGSGAAQIVL